jgi:hypothetical protein
MSHLVEMPQFEIEETTYTYKRLGVLTTQAIMELVQGAWMNGLIDLNTTIDQVSNLTNTPVEEVIAGIDQASMMNFFMSKHMLEDFLDFQSKYLLRVNEDGSKTPVSLEMILDEDKFPMYSTVFLFVFFLRHPDLGLFLSALKEGKELPLVQDLLAIMKEKMATVKLKNLPSNSTT